MKAQETKMLEKRARDVCAQFRANPGEYEKLFAPSFLAQVPLAQLNQIFTQYFEQLGACTDVKLLDSKNASSGKFDLIFAKGFSAPLTIEIEADAAQLLAGAFIGNPAKLNNSLEEVVGELKKLEGETSLYIGKLDASGSTLVIAHNADQQMPLGSAFKLYILSELVRQINIKQRKWSDVVLLRENYKSLPSGISQSWVTDTPVTLQTLATIMISISDNTATDALLFELGRENVEKAVAANGHSQPSVNVPFLSTGEIFRLKSPNNQTLAEKYITLDAKTKRDFLINTIASIKRDDLQLYATPRFVDKIEWFASSADICRLLASLKKATDTDKTAREIMSINPGLTIPRERWQYAGFKGGSEPGVLNASYLLQSVKGDWYAFSVGLKNTQKPVEEKQFFAIVQRIFSLVP